MLLEANYRTFLKEETLEEIDDLLEKDYKLEEMLAFIDDYEQDAFIRHYTDYAEAVRQIGLQPVEAFMDIWGVDEVGYATDAYVGWYQSTADFASEWASDMGAEIPEYVVVDWEATWDCNLQYDYDEVPAGSYGVHIFSRNY